VCLVTLDVVSAIIPDSSLQKGLFFTIKHIPVWLEME
jgi:hypothetical protein